MRRKWHPSDKGICVTLDWHDPERHETTFSATSETRGAATIVSDIEARKIGTREDLWSAMFLRFARRFNRGDCVEWGPLA